MNSDFYSFFFRTTKGELTGLTAGLGGNLYTISLNAIISLKMTALLKHFVFLLVLLEIYTNRCTCPDEYILLKMMKLSGTLYPISLMIWAMKLVYLKPWPISGDK